MVLFPIDLNFQYFTLTHLKINEWVQTLLKIGATFNYLIVYWIPLNNHQKESIQEKKIIMSNMECKKSISKLANEWTACTSKSVLYNTNNNYYNYNSVNTVWHKALGLNTPYMHLLTHEMSTTLKKIAYPYIHYSY